MINLIAETNNASRRFKLKGEKAHTHTGSEKSERKRRGWRIPPSQIRIIDKHSSFRKCMCCQEGKKRFPSEDSGKDK